jgi:hypothetical protein
MAKTGRGNKAIDEIPAALRAEIDALLDMGKSPTEIYTEFPAVQAAMALRTLQEYATVRRRERQLEIALDAKEFLDGLIDAYGIDRSKLDAVQMTAMGTVIKGMLVADKTSGQLRAIETLMEMREDQRKGELHVFKLRLAEAKAKIEAAAKPDAAAGGAKTVSLAEVARLLEEVDRAA